MPRPLHPIRYSVVSRSSSGGPYYGVRVYLHAGETAKAEAGGVDLYDSKTDALRIAYRKNRASGEVAPVFVDYGDGLGPRV